MAELKLKHVLAIKPLFHCFAVVILTQVLLESIDQRLSALCQVFQCFSAILNSQVDMIVDSVDKFYLKLVPFLL